MKEKTLRKEDLSQFTGTGVWYTHPLGRGRGIVYTEGAQYVAETGGAYWLLDEIVFNQHVAEIWREDFQCWKLTVDTGKSTGVLRCEDGNYNTVFTKVIEYTDFPLDFIELWFENNVIYLPSER